ncbi:MAG: alginate lyase family protein [Acidobacteriota bacterium]
MIARLKNPLPERPRPVFCIIENGYQDTAIANQVCRGLFTHAGMTLHLGLPPNWFSELLPEDDEYRIEWSKFYYGLNLANAYEKTGDSKYLDTWKTLIDSWVEQVPVGFDSSDVTARRIQNWIYTWNRFADASRFPGFSYKTAEKIYTSLYHQIDYLKQNLTTERNHRTLELYALFIASLAFPTLDQDSGLLRFAVENLEENIQTDILADGVHREQSTHYHMTVLRSFIGALANGRRLGIEFSSAYKERLVSACEFALHCHRPDGWIPALSDSDTGSYLDLLGLAGQLLNRSDFIYVASKGRKGVAPVSKFASFHKGGYFFQRSGWGEEVEHFDEEKFLVFDCGPLGDGGHGHYDSLNVEIFANRNPLIIDPGRFTYNEGEPNLRHWFKGTKAHNTVCVDGLDQTAYRRGKALKGSVARSQLSARLTAPDFDVLIGTVESRQYEVVHTRRIFFVNREYWLINDQLIGQQPHHYDLRFHLSPDAQNDLRMFTHRNNQILQSSKFQLISAPIYQTEIAQGWYAPEYGVKYPAPVVSISTQGQTEARFFTLIYPYQQNRIPKITVLENGQSSLFRIQISGLGKETNLIDHLVISAEAIVQPQKFHLGNFQLTASAGWLRTTESGEELMLQACQVQEIHNEIKFTEKFNFADKPIRWLTWDMKVGLHIDDGRGL